MQNRFSNLSIETKEAYFEQLTEYIETLRKEPDLRELFIEMTINCNEHCLHCGSNCGDIKSDNQLSDKEILRMLVDLRNDLAGLKKPLPFLSITGGEPLVRPGVVQLMKKIHYLGYKWGMTSNGILIDKDMALALKDAGMYSIGVSLDGLESTHDWFRQHPGAYKKTLDAVDYLNEVGFENVMVTTVVHKKNIDELDELYAVLKKHNVTTWRLTNIEPIGRAQTNSDLTLSKAEYKAMVDYIIDRYEDPDMQFLFTCNHYVGLDKEGIIRPWLFFCRAGLQVAAIQYDGTIGACLDIERREDLSYGNVRNRHIMDAWLNDFKIFREHKEEKSSKCSKCEHKKFCMGNGFHTWDFDNNEPKICMMENFL